ncbi:MAG TPA: sulfurtransferase [Blastocatellia bacterium]|nr:sulfurtransferase [Blastocatellia bacterium]HMX27084.1 sulfurtransferase [Blastocatellia bacterium]HMZ23270.1 sulfurtransferase [Blastocatellia bacterium]HNG34604.1 sulfurtransferase [Blastocatellia bacterium]
MKTLTRTYVLCLPAVICFCIAAALAQSKPSAPAVRAEMIVSTDWLAKHLSDKNIFVLHVARERKAYDDGHIPSARFIALGDLLTTREGVANELPPVEQLQKLFEAAGIGDEGRIVIYGENNGLAAARAFFTLDYLGHGARAALLDGGLEKWKAEKRELQTQAASFAAAKFTPRPQPGVLVKLDAVRDLSWVAANVPNAGVAIIDARPEEQYAGTANTRTGHIPGAANVFWMKHLNSAADPTLKPAGELQKLFAEAGLKPDQKIVTYCNTGMQASHSYFLLKYLGYDVSMYDASFSEWSKVESAPVVTGKEKK